MPSTIDLFGGHTGAYRSGGALRPDLQGTQVQERFLEYKAELKKSHERHDAGLDVLIPKVGIMTRRDQGALEKRMATIETLAKSVPADQLAAIQGQLDELRTDLAKDWNQAFPETGGYNTQLAPYNLQDPSKKLVPRNTPLRNAVPRNSNGKGSAVQFRRILGWSNANVGGVPDMSGFLNTEFPSSQGVAPPQFGGESNTTGGTASNGLPLRRGQKITYAADSQTINYVERSFSDSVSWKAQFIGQGFEDIRGLSHTATLWAHMIGEEKGLLYSRGPTSNNYTGPLAQPAAGLAVTSASTGGSIPAMTPSVFVTAAGGWGESVPSAVVTGSAITGTGTVTITAWPATQAGQTAWNVYMFNATTGSFNYQATVPLGAQGSAASGTVLTSYSTTTGTLAQNAADSSADVNGYDGFLTILLNPAVSGYVGTYAAASTQANSVNSVAGQGATGATPVGDAPWQAMFKALYGSGVEPGNYGHAGVATSYGQKLQAEPDVIYLDGTIRSALGSFVERGGTSGSSGNPGAYRIQLSQDAVSGVQMGSVVTGIVNQVTGKPVDLEVHPFMPVGVSFGWSKTLPVPDSEVGNTFEVENLLDYTGYDWPDIQFTYDFSTYQIGTFIPYAPAWSGAIVGLQP